MTRWLARGLLLLLVLAGDADAKISRADGVYLNDTQTLTNKTLTSPTLGGVLTLPTGFFSNVLTNTAAYSAITGAACGAATECYVGIAADGLIPAGAINAAKHRIEIDLAGVYGANATDTLAVKVKVCTVSACGSGTVVSLASTGTLTMVAATAQPWNARVVCNVFTAGASGTLDCQGVPGAHFFSAITTVLVDDMFNASAVTVDTTVAEYVSVSAQWSSTNAANTITLRHFGVTVF